MAAPFKQVLILNRRIDHRCGLPAWQRPQNRKPKTGNRKPLL